MIVTRGLGPSATLNTAGTGVSRSLASVIVLAIKNVTDFTVSIVMKKVFQLEL